MSRIAEKFTGYKAAIKDRFSQHEKPIKPKAADRIQVDSVFVDPDGSFSISMRNNADHTAFISYNNKNKKWVAMTLGSRSLFKDELLISTGKGGENGPTSLTSDTAGTRKCINKYAGLDNAKKYAKEEGCPESLVSAIDRMVSDYHTEDALESAQNSNQQFYNQQMINNQMWR